MLSALLGGTFDPIHYGHLRPAISLANEVGLKQISLLPNHIPPHKPQPEANTEQRLAMLKLAIEDLPLFALDVREIVPKASKRPSYTIETLQAWREENGNSNGLAFIMGQDSLLSLPTWNKWKTLLDYCHLLICRRPGYAQNTNNIELQQWIDEHSTTKVQQLHDSPHGYIFFAHTPLEDISATEIRRNINNQARCEKLLPPQVWHYIHQQRLYNVKK
ncbi:nicotinic acid mononucleotide adenylyltransferase [Gilliamella sp. Fer2-1]|jgi:nicotinate-nucleotide adenylyltransferase|uniref:nicotinate-nucleotide adenylyltransferase n=1 Tax=unclassified Gilliamella TaxID=2685620 RepID=UPI00080DC9BB|nr:nicotinate-nucleotide adenylyltransferase [Gilliamella apicola]OCG19589.1 nicotinic acid mononucleotide adenylyltransferase [Gilliamella apicola]OCG27780.1 nicotinic acid mononucleotide adenylyltransferase [Gilliamella apicola]OCG29920.1 nicotinic acid mononucleotide adenylyltransferase [Gilliamella apicola]OCG33919.1 nicotinic acid mononucleotide adenylyltransferase [Gilliamella apicola]